MRKRLILATVCAAIGMLALFGAPAVEAALTVRATDGSAAASGQDTIDVILESDGGDFPFDLGGFTVTLTYDDGVLEPPAATDVVVGADIAGGTALFLPNVGTPGEIIVAQVSNPLAPPTLTADVVLLTVTFTVQASPSSSSSPLTISVGELLDAGSQDMGASSGADGTFTVLGEPTPTPDVQFDAASSSGPESTTSVNLSVSLSAPSTNTVTVDYTATGGTATGGGVDYTLTAGTLTFTPGDTTENVAITVVDDANVELDETIVVTLSNPTNANLGTITQHTYTIEDQDEPLPTPDVQFDAASSSGPESTTSVNLPVSLSQASEGTVTVDYAATGGTASGADYTLSAGTLTFTPGDTTENIAIAVVDDSDVESDETIIVTLSNPSGANLGTNTQHTYTIEDDDVPPPTPDVQFDAASSSGPESTTSVNLGVSLSASSSSTVTVDYAVTGGTASGSGVDYTLAAGTLTFTPGDTTENIAITVVDDSDVESDETIIVTLSNPTNANLGTTTQHTYTILDDDQPRVEFDSAGSSGSEAATPALVTVVLSEAVAETVDVDYAVTGGTATGGGVDYTLASGTLTFTIGDTSEDISVTIVDDSAVELNETVVIRLSNPVGAALGTIQQHTYTIIDDDLPPTPDPEETIVVPFFNNERNWTTYVAIFNNGAEPLDVYMGLFPTNRESGQVRDEIIYRVTIPAGQTELVNTKTMSSEAGLDPVTVPGSTAAWRVGGIIIDFVSGGVPSKAEGVLGQPADNDDIAVGAYIVHSNGSYWLVPLSEPNADTRLGPLFDNRGTLRTYIVLFNSNDEDVMGQVRLAGSATDITFDLDIPAHGIEMINTNAGTSGVGRDLSPSGDADDEWGGVELTIVEFGPGGVPGLLSVFRSDTGYSVQFGL